MGSTTTARRMATKSARTTTALVNAIFACVIWPLQKLMSKSKTTSPMTTIFSILQPAGNQSKTVSVVRDQLTCDVAKQMQMIPPSFFTMQTTRCAATETAKFSTWAIQPAEHQTKPSNSITNLKLMYNSQNPAACVLGDLHETGSSI